MRRGCRNFARLSPPLPTQLFTLYRNAVPMRSARDVVPPKAGQAAALPSSPLIQLVARVFPTLLPICSACDVVRPEAAEAVALLSKLGCSAAMLTGDAAAAAQAVGAAVGLPPDHVHAQLLPEQKLSKVGVQAFECTGCVGTWNEVKADYAQLLWARR